MAKSKDVKPGGKGKGAAKAGKPGANRRTVGKAPVAASGSGGCGSKLLLFVDRGVLSEDQCQALDVLVPPASALVRTEPPLGEVLQQFLEFVSSDQWAVAVSPSDPLGGKPPPPPPPTSKPRKR